MFKGQGQTTLLSLKCCPLYIFLSLAYLLRTGFALTEKIHLNFVPGEGGIDVSETFLVKYKDFLELLNLNLNQKLVFR